MPSAGTITADWVTVLVNFTPLTQTSNDPPTGEILNAFATLSHWIVVYVSSETGKPIGSPVTVGRVPEGAAEVETISQPVPLHRTVMLSYRLDRVTVRFPSMVSAP